MQFFIEILQITRMFAQERPRINWQLVHYLARKLRQENGFKTPIFFHVFLIIRLFQGNPNYNKFAKLRILKRVLRYYLYEAGCSNLQIPRWWDNSHPLHRHRFLEAIYNRGCFKPWTFKLLYSTSIHGFSNSTFHELCDKQGPTMTIMKLDGKIVVAFVEKPWDTRDNRKLGYQEDRSIKMFHVDSTGKIVELRCMGFYNYPSSGPNFNFLVIDLDKREAFSIFPENNEIITGSECRFFVSIHSVVVLKMSIFFENFPITLLTQIASAAAPFLPIGDV